MLVLNLHGNIVHVHDLWEEELKGEEGEAYVLEGASVVGPDEYHDVKLLIALLLLVFSRNAMHEGYN